MDVATMRQLRGLVLAWRRRPERLRRPPISRINNRGRRYNNYSRFRLPTFGPLNGKGAYAKLGGRCRWCRQLLDQKGKRAWHEDCVIAYWAATGNQSALGGRLSSQYQREHGHHAPCAKCGGPYGQELDHRDALSVAWASGDERRLMRALSLGNLQWLCHDCHAAKTGRDRGLMRDLLDEAA